MKNLKNLGQALSKAEQKTINGGLRPNSDGYVCHTSPTIDITNCPSGTTYMAQYNRCCYGFIVAPNDPTAL